MKIEKKPIKKEIEMYEEIYKKLSANGKRPTGEKREWIGQQIGISGRNVDRIKAEDNTPNASNPDNTQSSNDTSKPKTVVDVDKAIKRNKKAIEKTISLMEEVNVDSSTIDLLKAIIIDLDNIDLI